MLFRTRRVLAIGLAAGLIGYAAVVAVITTLNLAAGRSPWFTAALFGSALFYDLHDATTLVIAPAPVLAYNAVHLVVFVALGVTGSALVALAERYPAAHYLVLVLLLIVAFHTYGVVMLFARGLLGAETWWHIGIGTLVAAVAMALYYLHRYPLVVREARLLPMGQTAFPAED
jgi:hypothetical protein